MLPPFLLPKKILSGVSKESDSGSGAPHLLLVFFFFLLQDNPEVEKRDPQELVGEYPGVEGTRGQVSEPHPEPAGFQPRRWLLSAAAEAAAQLLSLSLDSNSQGLWHFLRCLGETPREQFFENRIYGASHGALVTCQCRQRGTRAPLAGACSPCALSLASRPWTPRASLLSVFTGSGCKHVASAGMLLCPREEHASQPLEPGALCVTG